MTGSTPVPGEWKDQGNLRFWTMPSGRLHVEIKAADGSRVISVQSLDLANALNETPGFTVKYVEPVRVPSYLGAVVERPSTARRADGRAYDRWFRVAYDAESSLPWTTASGLYLSNAEIAGVLANGGYEREPEFPQRRP